MNRFVLIRQHDSMQCGIACLQMICCYYGKKYSAEYLSRYCFATTEGVSMLGISQASKKIGLVAQTFRLTMEQLMHIDIPCILHWNQNHFVVLYKIRKGKIFYIADPNKGLVQYCRKELEHYWMTARAEGEDKGIAMMFEPTPEFYAQGDKCVRESRSFHFVWEYIMEYRKYFLLIFFSLMLGSVLQLVMPFLTQAIVDLGIVHKDIHLIWLILWGELMIILGRTVTDFMRRWLLLHISMRINISLVSDFFIKLLKLPMFFFDIKLIGDLLQRMSDHSRVQLFLTNQVLGMIFAMLNFVVFGGVLLVYSQMIFVVFLLCSSVYGLWIAYFLGRRKVIDYEMFEQQAINQSKTYQFITSMQEIKLQDCEHRRRWDWEDTQADLFRVQMKSQKQQQMQEAGSIFINELKNIFITVLAATAVINGKITFGTMLAIQYIVGQLNSPIEQLMSFIYSLQDVKISLERINEIHVMDNEDNASRSITEYMNYANGIELSSISFRYDPHGPHYVLNNVSMTIPKGKVTAIVGASGSGKTTLIKLMLGYYPVERGCIKIGDTNISVMNLKWWRRQCGVVMQEGVIFSESIARNIAVDDGDIDVERLEKAAEIACIKDYVMSLPLKFNTKIGRDGVGLSLGQKQRILIARAVYKDPDFIFLDEATNSLDANNERAIVENLSHFYCGKTVVIVAHRLSTVKNADQIIVLDGGKVVETGNHEMLTACRGVYYNLVRNQLDLGT